GSYNNNFFGNAGVGVQKFLIAFESDVPKGPGQPFSQPGTVLSAQVVTPGAISPQSGTFTEQLINGNMPEHLFQYNVDLKTPFPEVANTVYWLKIVALVDPTTEGNIDWGWHNRDWGIQDPLASTVPSPGEFDEGPVVTSNGPAPVWHFQDDAVNGRVDVSLS